MKKFLTLLSIALSSVCCIAKAQIEKGTVLIGGVISDFNDKLNFLILSLLHQSQIFLLIPLLE